MAPVKGSGKGWINEAGYRVIRAPEDTPDCLLRSDGTVLEHRLVLWRELGEGRHGCQWCGHEVAWEVRHRTNGSDEERWDALVVDHEDGDRANNSVGNLLCSCPWCNSNRPYWRMFGVDGADFAGVDPKERPKLGERAKADARKAERAKRAAPRRPAASGEPERPRSAVRRRHRLALWVLRWWAAPSLWSLRLVAGGVSALSVLGVGLVADVELVVCVVAALVVGVVLGVWLPGPPGGGVVSVAVEAAGPAAVTGWAQLGAQVDAYKETRKGERAAAVMRETAEVVRRVQQPDFEWDDEDDDESDDDVVVPLTFPNPRSRG